MSAEVFASFAITSFLVAASPGPIILYAAQAAMERGFGAFWVIGPAVLLGDASAMAVSLAGVGALVAAAPSSSIMLQTLGAAVLILVGAKNLKSAAGAAKTPAPLAAMGPFLSAYLLAALHPGAFIFYTAFFAQFIDATRSIGPQVVLLGGTFLGLAGLSILIWMALAASAGARMVESPTLKSSLSRAASLVMIGVGVGGLIVSLRP